ncbi:ABC-three component system protein [uncultured Paraglaciecola sp.]|uniref:ABC-three component system protein n=1 Tax=uncultured Paraglaciecola sp. TaxID=1765024 RepID=UPI002635D9C7|nr:ABC-three component system protein [uncultured Paraglaciecola sp.]
MTGKTHTEKTSAAGTIAGFDYQYYYFLYKLLTLKKSETIGFELLDDVHTQLDNDHLVLIQIKHTIQKKTDGATANLTELDPDLWKTLFNWSAVIKDKNDGRDSSAEQKAFVEKTTFILATNKSFSSNNNFLSNLSEFQNENMDFETMKNYLAGLNGSAKSEETKKYIDSVISLDEQVLKEFLNNIKSDLQVDSIIDKCKTALEEKDVNPKSIDHLFNQLDSVVRQDIFTNFSNSKKLIYSFEERSRKFRRYFDIANNPELKIQKFDGGLPDSIDEQTFIKQLLDIEDIDLSEQEIIQNYTRYRLMLESNLANWVEEGLLTSEEINIFEDEIFRQWETEYRSSYRRKDNPEEFIDIAHKILKAMRDKELSISGQKLFSDMSHGSLYSLSNKPTIGWLKNWEEKYK